MTIRSFVCAIALLLPFTASPTTWGEPRSIDDPVLKRGKCTIQAPASSGSYIYQWPSKYDQVFWPFTDPHGIWFCRQSGFTAFLEDVELNEREKAALSEHLPKIYKKQVTKRPGIRELLGLLEQSYSKRETTKEFQITLQRVLAYYNDAELKDYDAATSFRRKALALIEEELQLTNLEEGRKLEYLFVSSIYHRKLGEVQKSDVRFGELEDAARTLKDQKLKGYSEYLLSMKETLVAIVPGGPLASELLGN